MITLQHDTQVSMTLYKSPDATTYINTYNLKWSELLHALSKPALHTRKYARGTGVYGQIKNNDNYRRKNDNVIDRSIIAIDYDELPLDVDFNQHVSDVVKFSYGIYSSHNNAPNNQRYRLLIPISQPITPELYGGVVRAFQYALKLHGYDEQSEIPSQAMALPTVADDGQYFEFYYQDAPILPYESAVKMGEHFKKRDTDNEIKAATSDEDWLVILSGLNQSEGPGRNNGMTKLLGHLLSKNVNPTVIYGLLKHWDYSNTPPLQDEGAFDKTFQSIFKKHHRSK
ncbi:primase alpha helix C-terminal domain-containing protein [Mammaliicoccus vitulinus]|uniref:Primase alpha helix C-terminal domain-containing protein n=1 Tax=Mammaliicoccus vitulinus TaxID=71237 RepID=A0ABX7HFN2_9STAP|nr:primase alpha helix C-terminal domain-containing protein [Mammaliicoccus vitulinus]PNZ40917.1 hypothetical protein CD107_00925 [Mammaliicoccus vitulinus]QRO85140.1 primase alpha helix C-terminal domain-containing protein [Mammaliicoccus vitulinus]